MFRLHDVVYETRSFWVLAVGDRGFEVYKSGATHSTKVAAIGHIRVEGQDLGLPRAIAECERRQVEEDARHDQEAQRLRERA